MAADQHLIAAHREWLGLVQPTGLVVSPSALVSAGAILDRDDRAGQLLLRGCLEEHQLPGSAEPLDVLPDFAGFARQVLGWRFSDKGYSGHGSSGGLAVPPELELTLPDYGITLAPDIAVREPKPAEGEPSWQLLVRVVPLGGGLDATPHGDGLEATEHSRLERLLRHTNVPAGLLFNGTTLRLISAPRGESSGWLDFDVAAMAQTAGRPILAALRLLLSERRLLALPKEQRLSALLRLSREAQNEVSELLSGQVLQALYELLRGFQAADDLSGGELLARPLSEHPDEVYRALLTVILRLVFILYAEERGMLPGDDIFIRFYSLAGLHRRLREDDARYADTMGQRHGAWAQLLSLFRIVHDGARLGEIQTPPRHGALFDPDRYPFLEGRLTQTARQIHERIEVPAVPDGTVHRVLEKLLVLNGERISYRALDVEQIGSVYETMMGFRLRQAVGRSVAIRSAKAFGAPATVDLDALAEIDPDKRVRWLADNADRKLTANQSAAVKDAVGVARLHAALASVIDTAATPDLVPPGGMVLQPSAERRRSGSHYTPRSLTEPIVRTTLAPILEALRGETAAARPEQILELKVCDPAMGSAAFLVETCRQLAEELVASWHLYGGRPELPVDEDELTLARRLIAQRCLYGVDRNPVAVDLGKMSLWLATLAREHPLTFVDHALRHGDSLVGLSRHQIEAFNVNPSADPIGLGFVADRIGESLRKVADLRRQIREAADDTPDRELSRLWEDAQAELANVRFDGDLVAAAFFSADKKKAREAKRIELADALVADAADGYRDWIDELREAETPLVPFHWQIEFPEVFEREQPGFDAIVGNPPFLGGRRVRSALGDAYCDWLPELFGADYSNNADLVAAFFRRSFGLLRDKGCFGLIATNTIAQGDTRRSGLQWMRDHGAWIFDCRRRVKWPGAAAVVVSVVHVSNSLPRASRIDGQAVDRISAFLFAGGPDHDPIVLAANADLSFQGVVVAGSGFLFDDENDDASPVEQVSELIQRNPKNGSIIRPYIGGEEVNKDPAHGFSRWVIDFSDYDEQEARCWPDLMALVETKVFPYRRTVRRDAHRKYWWQFGDKRPRLRELLQTKERVLVNAQVSQHLGFAFLPADWVFAMMLNVFVLDDWASFAMLQCRIHEVWARFFASTLEDRLRYTPSDCFETFPFPAAHAANAGLGDAGAAYYEHRAALMVSKSEGLTKTYNRFHDPEESGADILRLRDLHEEVDKAVLKAYGWDDIPTASEFLRDYEDAKPRYRWPDEVRDEVLARLMHLNAKHAAAEKLG